MQPGTAPFLKIASDSDILEHAEQMFKRFPREMASEVADGGVPSRPDSPGCEGNISRLHRKRSEVGAPSIAESAT